MVASYPNFFLLMGPNSVTGHSSALFNTECTVDMMAQLLKPVVKQLKARSRWSGEEHRQVHDPVCVSLLLFLLLLARRLSTVS